MTKIDEFGKEIRKYIIELMKAEKIRAVIGVKILDEVRRLERKYK